MFTRVKEHTLKGLSAAIAMALFSSSASALELYKDDKNSLDIGGYFDIRYVDSDDNDEISDGTSRYNFKFNRTLTKGWTGVAFVEWGVQLASNPDGLSLSGDGLKGSDDTSDSIWLRHGYIGASHEEYGRITIGKQWSSVYTLAGATDILPVFGGNASGAFNFGTDGGFSGVGRAEQSIQYNNTFGDFSVSAQYQATDEIIDLAENNFPRVEPEGELTFDNSYGIAVIYNSPYGFTLGAGINSGEIEYKADGDASFTEDDELILFSATYGGFQEEGIHFAFVYSDMETHELNDLGRVMLESSGIEAIVSYRFDNDIIIHAATNRLEDDTDYSEANIGEYELNYYTVGGTYFWDEKINFFTEIKFDDTTLSDGSDLDEDETIAIGMKYTF